MHFLTVTNSGSIIVTPVSFFSDGGGFLSCVKANDTLNAA